ncbi:MAG: septum site-determining protein MinD [Ruminococcaceae bacterium]|nr:septum site-determining protein MinD [Oscillospiraceae bacterium]
MATGTAIVVASGKGGTGKTSLTGGIAACLARLERKVLCIDMDIGLRNLDISLGMSDRVLMDFSDVVEGRCTLDRAAVSHPDLPGLHLLTAPIRLPDSVDERGIAALLDEARQQFDYILLDAPAGLDAGFRLAACAADRAIVVATNDASSLRDAQRAVGELNHIKQVHLVVNRVQPKLLRRLRTTIDDAMDTAGLPLLGVVPEDPKVVLAANRGKPLILTGRRGAANACLNIAKRIEGHRAPIMRIR